MKGPARPSHLAHSLPRSISVRTSTPLGRSCRYNQPQSIGVSRGASIHAIILGKLNRHPAYGGPAQATSLFSFTPPPPPPARDLLATVDLFPFSPISATHSPCPLVHIRPHALPLSPSPPPPRSASSVSYGFRSSSALAPVFEFLSKVLAAPFWGNSWPAISSNRGH
jgi:hypothetical protein